MSVLLIKSASTFVGQATFNRPTLTFRIFLGTCANTDHNGSARRVLPMPPPPLPLSSQLTGVTISSANTQQILLEEHTMVLTKAEVKNPTDNKIFIARDIIDKQNKASVEQLARIADIMTFHLPKFFTTPHPFNLYTPDVVFLDNIRRSRTQGISPYAMRVALTKIYYRLRYISVNCEVLSLVTHPEESSIKIRWRIVKKPGLIQLTLFPRRWQSLDTWTDGVSTLHVNSDGKIYCHVCDNIELDESKEVLKKTIKNALVDRGLNV